MSDQSQILLQTKLHRPRLTPDLIVRTRLIELLNKGIDRQITLVCAPAGFGKTTLVCTWLEGMAASQDMELRKLPSAWLSLDENDSDLNLFLIYFINAVRTIFKKTCERTLALLRAGQQLPGEVLLASFSNDLEKLPGEFILVLDDYHIIRNLEVHNLLSALLNHWPEPLHLILISRITPSLPLDIYRAKGMINEIRTRDLRFTKEETVTYLSQSQFALMIQSALPLLDERFEGWPAGLHLATLSIRTADNQESVLRELSSNNPNITRYLVDEVLAHQVPEIRSFLLKTSILNHFCTSLCEAVIGESDTVWNVRACLDWIEGAELFIIALDNQREWYRYHHLFQELLLQKLSSEMSAEQVTSLHRLASVWFEEHGLLDEALHHALAIGDLDLAARQMITGLGDVVNQEDRSTLERWIRLMPEDMIQRQPGLLMIKAWVLQFIWRLDLQTQVLRNIEELLDLEGSSSLQPNDLRILCGQILVLKAQQAYFTNQLTEAIDLCRQALALLPPAWMFVRGGAMLYLGMSMQACGQALEAERLLLDEYESSSDKTTAYALLLLRSLCFIYLNSSRLEQARQIAQLMLQGATSRGVEIQKNWGDWVLGVLHYQRNELEDATQYFTQITENRYTAQIATYRDAIAGLALMHQIKGESSDAMRMVESISQFDLEQRGSEDYRTRSLRARLMLLQGDLEGAGDWVNTLTGSPPEQPLMWLEEPQVTRVRILFARGTNTDLHSVVQILDSLDEIASRTHNTRYKIEILAMRSLVLDAQGMTREANDVLNQALDLARPGGFIRVFVDLGKPLQRILCRLAKQDYSTEMIRRILVAFPKDDKSPVSSDRHPTLANSSLAEPLTPRELEVLSLLRGPSSIKEIALNLNISSETVKRHTANIYGKLGVNQRWNAVAKAEELNILSPR